MTTEKTTRKAKPVLADKHTTNRVKKGYLWGHIKNTNYNIYFIFR